MHVLFLTSRLISARGITSVRESTIIRPCALSLRLPQFHNPLEYQLRTGTRTQLCYTCGTNVHDSDQQFTERSDCDELEETRGLLATATETPLATR